MWACRAVNKTFVLLLAAGLLEWGRAEQPSFLIAERVSRIKKGRRALPKARRTFKRAKKKTFLRYVKPPSQAGLYFEKGTDEAELERVILLEIRQLYKLLKTSSRPDIQLRLASLYVEQSRLIESRVYDAYSREMSRYKSNRRKTLPKLNLSHVREYSQKAIRLFQAYIQKYPRSRKMDSVLSQLAYSYLQMGQPQKSRSFYERLVRRFPKSDYVESARFQLGEYYFDRKKWTTARLNYDKASRFNGRFYSFSLYKISWCLYNEGRVETAMRFMEKVISDGRKPQSRVKFSNEALGDLAGFYIYSKYKAGNVFSYFENLVDNDDQKLFRLLEKVAFTYKDTGDVKSMRLVFNTLIRLQPYHPKAYDYKYQIVQAYSYAGRPQLFKREFTEWVEGYGPNSVWSRKNSSDFNLIAKVNKLLEVSVRNYAFRMHHAFLKTRSLKEKNQSLFGYQLYFQGFKTSDFYAEVRFHYGELLFDIGRFQKAAVQYSYVIKNFPKSKIYETALLNRVLALEKTLPSEKEVKKAAAGRKTPALPGNILSFREAIDDYIVKFPKKKSTYNMIYTLGKILFEYKRYPDAVGYWMKIAENPSLQKSSILNQAVHSILDAYNLMKDFENLHAKAKAFVQIPAVKNSAEVRDIYKILREIEFKKAQDLMQAGQVEESARLYEQFYQNNSRSKLAVTALYNAALNYKKSKNTPKAVKLYVLLSRLPQLSKHPVIKKRVLRALPDFYQLQGMYLQSAYAFKKYAESYPKEKNIGGYWYNAAIIFDGMNFYDQAVSAYLRYKSKTSSLERNQIYFLIARIRERQKQKRKAIGNYIQYLNTPDRNRMAQVIAGFKIAELSLSLGQKKTAQKWYKRTVSIHRKYKTGGSFSAQSQFYFAHEAYKKFKSLRIPRKASQQAQAVQNKLNQMEVLKQEVKKVIRLRHGPLAAAALTLMALANKNMGESILNSAIPKGLTRPDVQRYKQGLAQTAQPFMDSSRQYFEQISKQEAKCCTPWLKTAWQAREPGKFQEKLYSLQIKGVE